MKPIYFNGKIVKGLKKVDLIQTERDNRKRSFSMNKSIYVFLLSILFLTACSGANTETQHQNSIEVSEKAEDMYKTKLKDIDGNTIGTATLTEGKNGVTIHLKAEKLPPGVHGFHIHEKGECQGAGFESAGGHFNPYNKEHGLDNPKGPHAGDLPNIEVDQNGKVDVKVVAPLVTLEEGKENSLFDEDGSALMIHEKADDNKTNPAGDAGSRIACGVIQK